MLTAREKKNQRNREYYARNRDRILAKQKIYYANNREKIVAQKNEYQSRDEVKKRRWYLAKLRSCGVSIPELVSV